MENSVFQRLEQRLQAAGVAFDVLRHEPAYTSEEAARVRGTPLASGAKALICKADEQFIMIVLPADQRLDSKLVRTGMGVRSLRFATREEVAELTGLSPGSIPPFGSLFGLASWCDGQLGFEEKINFNAGDHSISVSLAYIDYLALESPQLGRFTSAWV